LVALAEEEVDTLVKDELLDLLFVGFGFGAEDEALEEEGDDWTWVELLDETECP